MGRPLRIEVPGGFFHVGTRGVNREAVFYEPRDRRWFLQLLLRATRRFDWLCVEYCLMGNHYHLLLQTPEPTLARGMQFLNGEYARYVNDQYGRDGHLFARRYWSELIETDAHLLETCRYVVLNPVRAGLCSLPEDWLWSGFAASAGIRRRHPCLSVAAKLDLFGASRDVAQKRYRSFVNDGL
jgi:REP element-mobilizing transposase RayT